MAGKGYARHQGIRLAGGRMADLAPGRLNARPRRARHRSKGRSSAVLPGAWLLKAPGKARRRGRQQSAKSPPVTLDSRLSAARNHAVGRLASRPNDHSTAAVRPGDALWALASNGCYLSIGNATAAAATAIVPDLAASATGVAQPLWRSASPRVAGGL